MGIIIRNKGFLTTIQDLGRIGYQQFGVPASGAMDGRSMKIANLLVDNPEDEAVVEMLLLGAQIEFSAANVIAITGADLSPAINGVPAPIYAAISVKPGDTLSFEGMRSGSHCYVAFAGGLDIPQVMGSKSTYIKAGIGGYQGRKFENNDHIPFAAPKVTLPNMRGRAFIPEDFSQSLCDIRVIMGPQEDCFTPEGIETFLSNPYTITNEFDRMGCRLEGKAITHIGDGNIISDGIAFGAVQVPSHGKPIIMLADRQTVGGYAKIATVISVDLPKLVQKSAGDKIRFRAVSLEEAQALYLTERQNIAALRDSLNGNPTGGKPDVNRILSQAIPQNQ